MIQLYVDDGSWVLDFQVGDTVETMVSLLQAAVDQAIWRHADE